MGVGRTGRAGRVAVLAAVLAASGVGLHTARAAISLALEGTTSLDQAASGTYTFPGNPQLLVGDANVTGFDPATLGCINNVVKWASPTGTPPGETYDVVGQFQSHVDFDTVLTDGGVLAYVNLNTHSDPTMGVDSSVDASVSGHVVYSSSATFSTLYEHARFVLDFGLFTSAYTDGGIDLDTGASELPTASASVRILITSASDDVLYDHTFLSSGTDLPPGDMTLDPGTTVTMTFEALASQHMVASTTDTGDLPIGWEAWAQPSLAILPEPGTLGLMGMGMLFLAGRKKWARQGRQS